DSSAPDCRKAKGVRLTEVRGAGAGVTHLQAGRGSGDARIRAHQVQHLLESIRHVHAPLVVMGDFNFFRDDPTDRASEAALRRARLVDCAGHTGALAPTYVRANPYAGNSSATERFDRIYTRAHGRWWLRPSRFEVLSRVLSDHLPVYATLELERT
ncbi:MAG: endonuclease/exonuclease/phosphatase family protein, partial [Miltoncostaeaceae bacterium]